MYLQPQGGSLPLPEAALFAPARSVEPAVVGSSDCDAMGDISDSLSCKTGDVSSHPSLTVVASVISVAAVETAEMGSSEEGDEEISES
jgi:hypothetical protein